MRLWILRARSFDDVPYDGYDAFVISAETEGRAREMAQEKGGDECGLKFRGEEILFWLDYSKTSCEPLKAGPEGIVLGSFNAG